MIYAAKSTEDRHGSVPTQLADCRAMADSEGWCVVDEYRDEGFSAYHGNRGPGLVAAREQAARVAADQGSCVL
ncbi:MAG TPA: recombinase family protein, partial [Baekduia sp.]|nr:recombinase family protein [Baekduia sp.]